MGTSPTPVQEDGLNPNMAGGLAYITIIPAIIFLAMAPYNRDPYVRFHAWQSLILGVAWIVMSSALRFIPLGFMIWGLVWVIVFIVWLIAMLKAFQGQKWKIPVIGSIAEQQASKGGI